MCCFKASSNLICMYVKCGVLSKAQQVLDGLLFRDLVSWSALISGYAKQGYSHEALSCFQQMLRESIPPNEVTFVSILKACGSLGAINKGEQICNAILFRGLLQKNIVLGNALIDMYVKCGVLTKAHKVLETLPTRNIISWSTLIMGYAQHGQAHEALGCFECMQTEGLSPNEVTFSCILKACGLLQDIDRGNEIHDQIIKRDFLQKSMVLGNAVIDMYARCGMLTKASQAFWELPARNVVSWNTLIAGFVQHEQGRDALKYFSLMQMEGISPNEITFACALKACGTEGDIDKGKCIHDLIVSRGLLRKNIVLANAVVGVYAKCGLLSKAQEILEELPVRNVASWSALITGYTQQEKGYQAFKCLAKMQREGIFPNEVTFVAILKACNSVGALGNGKQIHDEIVYRGLLKDNIVLGNAMVEMYANSGMLMKAQKVLEELPIRDVVSWSSLVSGYAQQGNVREVRNCFVKMQSEGLPPNEVTFLSVLAGCTRAGNADEAQMYYEDMSAKYGITPKLEHHTCMIAVLGYTGRFDKAISVIRAMSCHDYPPVWSALLGACRKWGKLKLARLAFDQAIKLDEKLAVAYIHMSNIYLDAGMQEDAEKIEAMQSKKSTCKKGRSKMI